MHANNVYWYRQEQTSNEYADGTGARYDACTAFVAVRQAHPPTHPGVSAKAGKAVKLSKYKGESAFKGL